MQDSGSPIPQEIFRKRHIGSDLRFFEIKEPDSGEFSKEKGKTDLKARVLDFVVSPCLLDSVTKDFGLLGLGGDDSFKKLLFVAIGSRGLHEPLSLRVHCDDAGDGKLILSILSEVMPVGQSKHFGTVEPGWKLSDIEENELKNGLVLVDGFAGHTPRIQRELSSLIGNAKVSLTRKSARGVKHGRQIINGPVAWVEVCDRGDCEQAKVPALIDVVLGGEGHLLMAKKARIARATVKGISSTGELDDKIAFYREVQKCYSHQLEVAIPFVDRIFVNDVVDLSIVNHFLRLLEAVVSAHRFQRHRSNTANGISYVCADFEDYRIAYDLWSRVVSSEQQWPEGALGGFCKAVKRHVESAVESTGQCSSEYSFTSKEIVECTGSSSDLVRRRLGELVKEKIIKSDRKTPVGARGHKYRFLGLSGSLPMLDCLMLPKDLKSLL